MFYEMKNMWCDFCTTNIFLQHAFMTSVTCFCLTDFYNINFIPVWEYLARRKWYLKFNLHHRKNTNSSWYRKSHISKYSLENNKCFQIIFKIASEIILLSRMFNFSLWYMPLDILALSIFVYKALNKILKLEFSNVQKISKFWILLPCNS